MLLLLLAAGNLVAQSANQLVAQGRVQLAKQTSDGLRKADALFAKALAKNPNHEAANVLKTGTSLALVNSLRPTKSTLKLLGIGTNDPNPFDPEYTITFDTKGRPVPSETATTRPIRDWNRNVALPQIDAALVRLAKVRNKKFLLTLTKRETGGSATRIDYGDVHAARFFLLMAKAAVALQETYNSDASLYAVYQMIRRGELDLETFLNRYPAFLTRTGADQRVLSKTYFLAAERAYRLASSVLSARAREGDDGHLFSFDNRKWERDFRNGLGALAKSFTSTQQFEGVRFNLGRAVTTSRTPRSLLGRVRGNGVVPGTWPDPTLGGVLIGTGSKFLQRQADSITRSLNTVYPTPTITSPRRADGRVGLNFTYEIKANLKPRSFATGPLPPDLKRLKTGVITGRPTQAGTYSVKVTANTNAGPASRIVTIVVRK